MRMLSAAAGAVLFLLAASPALAGGPTGHPGGHPGGCGQCGGHTPPPPPPPACCHGGRNTNINVNVNAGAQASAAASARSYLNARTWSGGGAMSRGYVGGGTVYVGGGYGGDIGYVAGPVVYGEAPLAHGLACAPAPFGYTLHGFGREIGAPARCDAYEVGYREDRGGRYGYSERHESWSEESYREERYREELYAEAHGYEEVRHRDDRDCGCDRDRPPAPYPPAYLPEPPRYTPPAPPRRHARPAPRPTHRRPAPRPRQHYAQEPGERG